MRLIGMRNVLYYGNIKMEGRHYAAIDIGSNAVRLLIKRVARNEKTGEESLIKAVMLRVPLRLGFDVFSRGKISHARAKKLQRLMKAYRQLMEIYEVGAYRACATSAMRDAGNGEKLIRSIRKHTGINIEIIGGQEEALMIYNNHLECFEDRRGNYMYVDVGGGSTEVNLLVDGELIYSKSFNVGTVRLLTGGVAAADWRRMCEEVAMETGSFPVINIIGSGGNINKLFRLATVKDKEHNRLPIESLQATYDRLHALTPQQRMDEFGLMPDRADVIVPAAEIFLTLAATVRAEYIYVPVIGLADGIVDSLYMADKVCIDKGEEK